MLRETSLFASNVASEPDFVRPTTSYCLITLCTHKLRRMFGEVCNHQMQLNELGQIASEDWQRVAASQLDITLESWILMPNHIHGLLVINTISKLGNAGRQTRTISTLVTSFKMAATKRINLARNTPGALVWQRSYQHTPLPNKLALSRARKDILNNPQQWSDDPLNPQNIRA